MSCLPPSADSFAFEFLGRQVGNAGYDSTGRPHGRHRVLMVAELGINHGGDAELAKRMVREAAAAGADVVKLQLRDLKACYGAQAAAGAASSALAFYLPILRQVELPLAAYGEIKALAESLGVGFLVTPFDEPSVARLEELGVGAYKIASCDAINPWVLDAVTATGKPLVVSTGMCSELEVFALNGYLRERAPKRYALMHSVSAYPTAFSDCQLHLIPRYKHNLGCPVGWSGHERGAAVSVAAAALGADIIERHFTLDRTMPGPDQAASLELDGMRKLVARVRAFEEAYGDPVASRHRPRSEHASEEVLRKSLHARRALRAGEPIQREDLEAVGPGRGISPWAVVGMDGKRWLAKRDVAAGAALTRDDIEIAVLERSA